MEHSVKSEIEIKKISRRCSRSPDNAKFGHFALLFCRGSKEMYKDCTAIVLLMKPFV